jgi:hypothetical protein
MFIRVACRLAVFLVPGLAALPLPMASAAERPVNIIMEDQFRHRCETGAMQGDVVVLVYAGRKGAEAALDLGRKLHTYFHPTADGAPAEEWSTQPVIGLAGWPAGVRLPDVRVIPVACVPEVPRALHAVARNRLRKESPVVSVWLDFEDVMRQSFGMVPDEPNVVILDTRGVSQGVLSGHVDDLELRELVATIDGLRTRAQPTIRTASAELPGAPVR